MEPITEWWSPSPHFRLWLDAIYWSLTTMTTIGYGDRGPVSASEIAFVIFAEVFGLAFFALLLTQINNVVNVMALEQDRANLVNPSTTRTGQGTRFFTGPDPGSRARFIPLKTLKIPPFFPIIC